jgi:uncharacterized protein YecE (DUF72 family)
MILVGTAGWADRDLIASGWYPRSASSPAGRLSYYAERFPLVEVDSSYYAIPAEQTVRGWATSSSDLVLDAKAYSLLTGQRTRSASLPAPLRALTQRDWITTDAVSPALLDGTWEHFHACFAPLRETGRLSRVLLQFPATYVFGTRALALVADALERCHPLRAAVEWRHPSWLEPGHRERSLSLLREHDAAFVCVDMPQGHPESMPPLLAVTSDTAVIRLHGHSPDWRGGSKEDRYRYEYAAAELADWAAKAETLAEQADDVHIVVNTCCAGTAQRTAAQLTDLLDKRRKSL